ncbi:MAG: FixH family protein [Betaproteobacteria bacterium]|nr:FixH family protein [Betaproteobacteria bacterium]
MVWLLIGLPATAVVASLVTAWIASNGADTLVNEPHHKVGLGMQAGKAPEPANK